jgi:hypothetical protein
MPHNSLQLPCIDRHAVTARVLRFCRAASKALSKVLLKQIQEVATAGASFTAAVNRLTSSSSSSSASSFELKPAYQKMARVAQQLQDSEREWLASCHFAECEVTKLAKLMHFMQRMHYMHLGKLTTPASQSTVTSHHNANLRTRH